MAAPIFDQTSPDPAHQWDTDLDAIRDNITWLMIAAASAGYMLPNWTTAVNGTDKSEPDDIVMISGSKKMRWQFTWVSGNVTQIVWQYDRGLGAGYETLAGGTVTPAYNASDEFTGVTTA